MRWVVVAVISITILGCSLFSSSRPARVPTKVKLGAAARYIGGLEWPVKGAKITSGFGWRSTRFHDGLDLSASQGVEIRAAHDGTVAYSGNSLRGYGNMVVLKGADGLVTVYGHNRSNKVKKGQSVKRGQVIGYVGKTGRASGPHLHFETRVLDAKGKYVPVDPKTFFR